MITEVHILIIGASQAGLAMGYFLKQKGVSFAILGKENRIGDTWRNRYDSLELFTPRWFSGLPGKELNGNPNGCASKNEMAEYLEEYAKAFNLPVQLNVAVNSLEKSGDLFKASTNSGIYLTKKVVIATGPFQKAYIPSFAKELSPDIYQVHTSAYTNPRQLQPGAVLVVGAGNSGAQISVELSRTREVFLSVGQRLKFFPYKILGKSIFWWFEKIGLYRITTTSGLGAWIRNQGDPIFGKQLKKLIRSGKVVLKPRTVKAGVRNLIFEDGSSLEVQNIIWATGFYPDYSWINISNVIDEKGNPSHHRGVSTEKGLYFLGLPWQYNRSSALIGGVGADAEYLAGHMFADKVTLQLQTV